MVHMVFYFTDMLQYQSSVIPLVWGDNCGIQYLTGMIQKWILLQIQVKIVTGCQLMLE